MMHKKEAAGQSVPFEPSTGGFQAVLKMLRLTRQQRDTGHIVVVRLLSKVPVRVPANRTSATISFLAAHQSFLLHHLVSTLPGALCASSCLISLPAHVPYKVPVIITNKSRNMTDLKAKQSPIFNVNFGNSAIPSEWKQCVLFPS